MTNYPWLQLKRNLIGDMSVYHLNIRNASIWRQLKALRYLRHHSPGFNCVFWFRVNQYFCKRSDFFCQWIGKRLSVWRIYRFGNDISCKADIGPGLRVVHLSDIVIGTGVRAGENLTILNGVSLGKKSRLSKGMPQIGNNVFIGSGSKIIGDIEIGDDVVIGALTFCDKSIPANNIAYGNPITITSLRNQKNNLTLPSTRKTEL